jgi:hypothetical protein
MSQTGGFKPALCSFMQCRGKCIKSPGSSASLPPRISIQTRQIKRVAQGISQYDCGMGVVFRVEVWKRRLRGGTMSDGGSVGLQLKMSRDQPVDQVDRVVSSIGNVNHQPRRDDEGEQRIEVKLQTKSKVPGHPAVDRQRRPRKDHACGTGCGQNVGRSSRCGRGAGARTGQFHRDQVGPAL